MKKTILSLIAIGLLAIPFKAYAQESTLPDAGLTPESPLYFLDKVVEYVDLLFTFNEDEKIEKELNFAEERLAEMEEISDTADEETLTELEGAYNTKIANAIYLANQGEEKENRLQVIEQARERHVENMQRVLDKAPEQAKPALEKVLEKAQVKLQDIQDQIEEENGQEDEDNGDVDKTELKKKVKNAVENAGKKAGNQNSNAPASGQED